MKLALTRLQEYLRDPLYRHSSYLIVANAVSAGTGFAFWLVAARSTDAEAVGRAAALIAAVSFLVYLTSLGLPYGVLRYAGAVRRYSPLINFTVLLSTASSVVASLIFISGSPWWAQGLTMLLDSPTEVLLFVSFNVTVAVGLLLDSTFSARRATQFVLFRSMFLGAAKLVGIVALISLGASGIYYAMFLPILLSTGFLLVLLPSILKGYQHSDAAYTPDTKELIRFSLGNYPASLFAGATPFLLPLVVLSLRGSEETAYFYVAWNITVVLHLVPTAISQMSLSEGARGDAWKVARRAQRFALLTAVPMALVVFLGTDIILAIYGSEYAAQGGWPLRFLVVSTLPWALVTTSFAALRAENRYSDIFILSALLFGLTLALAVMLSFPLGISGIAVGWTLGLFLTAIVVEIRVEMITGWLRSTLRRRCGVTKLREA